MFLIILHRLWSVKPEFITLGLYFDMEKDILVKGQKLHYEETGKPGGFPVVVMHGWGCDHTTVRSIAASLEAGMRVINVDLPGHGKSPEPTFAWGVVEYTQCLKDFISALGVDSPALIGHSFGGRIAIMYGSQNKTGKIVLVDAAGIKPKRKFSYYWKVYSFKALKKLSKLILGKEGGEAFVEKMRNSNGSADYRNASPVMRAVMSRCVNQDLKRYMPGIKAPVLLIWGDDDTATPLDDAKIMEKLIPDAGLVSFPGCGHYSFLDNPFGFRSVLREFFKDELK